MSFMPSVGSRLRLTDGRLATLIAVTPLGFHDRVRFDDGSEARVTAWDIAEIIDETNEVSGPPRPDQNAMIRDVLAYETRQGHVIKDAVITARPQSVAFKPERVRIDPPALPTDWIIKDITFVNVVHEDLIGEAYEHDRRKAGRKIRQQRRRIRRINKSFGHKRGVGVPEVMRTKIALR